MKLVKKILLTFALLIFVNDSITYAHDDLPDPKSLNNTKSNEIYLLHNNLIYERM